LENTVGVNVEGNFNLRLTTRHRRNPRELELTEQVVVASHTTLTLINLDKDTRLVISEGREYLVLLGWNGGVTGNENSHDTTRSLETKGEWGNVKQKDIVELLVLHTGKNGGLNGSTISDSLIRIDGLVELLSVEEVLQELLDLGNTSRATNEDNFVDLSLIELGIS